MVTAGRVIIIIIIENLLIAVFVVYSIIVDSILTSAVVQYSISVASASSPSEDASLA